ncbi:fungal-specific transcription factor domain-containing protein [Mycena galopus ATCC 62051]|nr:fungal-specific transcription factor domain-containing protein [Mycena galopus ATCC 62051]
MTSGGSKAVPEPFSKNSKQRRQQRSCDFCRNRKIRCDGPNKPNDCCSNCVAFGVACTYEQPYQKRGPKDGKKLTIEQLQRENASLKAQLRALSVCSLCAQPLQIQPPKDASPGTVSVFHNSPESGATMSADSKEPPEEQEWTGDDIVARFSLLSVSSMDTKYFGNASSYALASNAITMKEEYTGRLSTHWRRPLFWEVLPWEKEAHDLDLQARPSYVYPADDLITSLLELYFSNVHPTIPILHRPSFERSVMEGLHLTNREFGGLLLSVLAIASWYSNDPRVFVNGDASLSSGWKFANQVRIRRQWFEPTIHEVQMYGLLTLFAVGTSVPQVSWLYLGLGIRCLLQRGVHRRNYKSGSEGELWKRAFWTFISLERMICLFNGRPMSLHAEDYDVQLPLAVDDEYWDRGFVQPLGKPSQLSYFVCHSRLCEILGDAFRQVYASKKAKLRMGWDGPEWEQRAVANFDSSMNDYLDSVPHHLRWDPENPPEGVFFDQAVALHITYNYILIVIHRRNIQKMTAQGSPSLSICASAARTILHTADIWLKKRQRVPLPSVLTPVFVSGVILVLYTLGTKRAGLPIDKNKDLVQVATAMDILKFSESRSQPVGRLWELLGEILSFDSLPSNYPRNNAVPDSVEPDQIVTLNSGDPNSTDIPGPPLPAEFPQLEQSFDFWNGLYSDPTGGPTPKTSLDELFAGGNTFNLDGILDDELLSMWMTTPADMANMDIYRQETQ